jgi:hypothetical protein
LNHFVNSDILSNGDLFSFHWLSSNDFLELIGLNSVKSTPSSLGITNTEVSLSTLRTKISNKTQKLWKKEWSENTDRGAVTRSFFSSPADAYLLKCVYINPQITQLLTGHYQLNRHFFKMKKIQSSVWENPSSISFSRAAFSQRKGNHSKKLA